MELPIISNNNNGVVPREELVATVNNSKFIEANTTVVGLEEIQNKHIIPVFVKDNSPLISQADFITTARGLMEEVSTHDSTFPAIRVSHPIKGRTFNARNKKASELLEHEKTLYYERMAFICEIPTLSEEVNDQHLSLCFGGVKAYNQDNLNNKGNANQHFKFFIGYKVKVCTNLCVWTDGFSKDIKVRSMQELTDAIYQVINAYDSNEHLNLMRKLADYNLSEKAFATLVGKARMYGHLPKQLRSEIPELLISDSQVSSMTREYYKDDTFRRGPGGQINLWNVYNLLTNSVKSSYIDSFLDRNANAFTFTKGIADALDGEGDYGWFLN